MKNKVGEKCWQAVGYAGIILGVVVSQEMRNDWLMYEVRWSGAIQTTWVKCSNVAFGIPAPFLKDQ